MADCPRCNTRGKTWEGADPKCAFPEGVFTSDNWNCATLNDLRDNLEYRCAYPQWVGIIPAEDGALVLYAYKRRGRVEAAVMLTEHGHKALTLEAAEAVLEEVANA